MILLELENFDYAAAFVSELEGKDIQESAFCPMFVFIVDWACRRGFLGADLLNNEVFQDKYKLLINGEIEMDTFVYQALDSKILDTYFKKEERKFLADYIEYDGYEEDLKKYFKTQTILFPSSLNNVEGLYKLMDKSRENYYENKQNYPDLIIFYDPEKLKKERELHEKESKK